MLNLSVDPGTLAGLMEQVADSVALKLKSEIQSIAIEARPAQVQQLLISTSEAARVLSVSERLLWGMTFPRGPIPCIKAGTRTLYSVDSLRNWIEAESTQQGAEGQQPSPRLNAR